MTKKRIVAMKKKPASIVQLTERRPQDVESVENLRKLAEVLPGCSDLLSALRWLCESEAPKATKWLKEKFA